MATRTRKTTTNKTLVDAALASGRMEIVRVPAAPTPEQLAADLTSPHPSGVPAPVDGRAPVFAQAHRFVFLDNERGNPPGKLADVEIHFEGGLVGGCKLIGFSLWERRTGTGRNVTYPARQYSVNGERRSFALLRPVGDTANAEALREAILEAYAAHEAIRDRERQ